MGYSFATLLKRPEADRRAISLETGVQNTGLGLILVFNFFSELGGMILIVAWWGVWDLVSTLFLSLYWSKRKPKL
jgi:BASS family bile acid:Na+ symporter